MRPQWLYETSCNRYGAYGQALHTATRLARVLWVLCAAMAVTGCLAHLKGVSGPVAFCSTSC